MKGRSKAILAVLVVLLALSTYALIRTGRENVAPNAGAATTAAVASSASSGFSNPCGRRCYENAGRRLPTSLVW